MKSIQIAQVCHEVNKAYCEFLGDKSQVSWEETEDNIKASAIDGVEFHYANPTVTPADSHANWKRFKKEEGWVYGKVKDSEKKTHPCMVAYSKLPEDQRVKDVLFKQIVSSLGSLRDVEHLGNTEVAVESKESLIPTTEILEDIKETLSRIEARLDVPVKPKVAKKIYPSRARVIQRPKKGASGFAQPTDVVRKAAVTNTTEGSGGSLNIPKRVEAPVVPESTKEAAEPKGGLIESGAGDGAAALAMFDQQP